MKRVDWYMRQHVDQGLELARAGNLIGAAEFMYSKGVPIHVAARLLAKNNKSS